MSQTVPIAVHQQYDQPDPAQPLEKRPGAGLSFLFVWLFILAIYARPEDIFPSLGQLHLTFLLGVCAAVTFLWSLFLGTVTLTWPPELRLVLLLTVWFIAGVPFAYWRGGSLEVLTQIWLKTVLIFFLMTQTLVSLKRMHAVLWAIILSELAVTAYSLVASSGVIWVGDRLYGVSLGILGWNFLGIAAAMTIPYIAVIFITQPSVLKSGVLAAATISMFWMLALTASRSGILAVAVSVVLTWGLVLRGNSRGKLIGVGIVCALFLVLCLAPAVLWERMDSMWGNASSNSADQGEASSAALSESSRWEVLVRSINYTLEYPVFGLGLGNLIAANGNELRRPDAWIGSHNTFTEISSEAGIPALVVFVALLVTSARRMMQIGRASFSDPRGSQLQLMARATLASLLSFAFGACFAHLGYEYFLYTGPIALAAGIQRVASDWQVVGSPMLDCFTEEPRRLTPGWTI